MTAAFHLVLLLSIIYAFVSAIDTVLRDALSRQERLFVSLIILFGVLFFAVLTYE